MDLKGPAIVNARLAHKNEQNILNSEFAGKHALVDVRQVLMDTKMAAFQRLIQKRVNKCKSTDDINTLSLWLLDIERAHKNKDLATLSAALDKLRASFA